MTYSGPIPHPQLLKEFNDVIPNGADRIMTMAEKQSEHRISLEEKLVNANNRDSLLGVVFGGVIALLIVLGTIFLIYTNKDIQGFSLLIGSSVAYISVFLKSKSRDDKDLEEKSKKHRNSAFLLVINILTFSSILFLWEFNNHWRLYKILCNYSVFE